MIKSKFFLFLILIIGYLTVTGCSTRLADFSIITTQNVALDTVDIDSMPQTRGIIGRDAKFMFLFIPFGFPHVEDAVDDALQKGNGDLMVDGVLYNKGWWFLIGQNILEIKGTVVKTRGN